MDLGAPEEAGASADVRQRLDNRKLRGAVAYTELMCLIVNPQMSDRDRAFLKVIARGLEDMVRTGCGPSNETTDNLYKAHGACHPAGPLFKAVHRAIYVISDAENASLNDVHNDHIHLAHVLWLAVSAADEPSRWPDGLTGFADVMGKLPACATLLDAKQYLDQLMCSESLDGDFLQRLEPARSYLQQCVSDSAFRPNRFPVEALWQGAIDDFYR